MTVRMKICAASAAVLLLAAAGLAARQHASASQSPVSACAEARLDVFEQTGELWSVDYRSLPACRDLDERQSSQVLVEVLAGVERLQQTGHR
jgi:hypothetical protein